MKKLILGSAAAVCCAILFSSLRAVNVAGPYYFKVVDCVNVLKGSGGCFTPSQVTYIPSIAAASCTSSGYDCVVTFATSDLTANHQHLKGSGCVKARNTLETRGAC